MSNSQKNFMTIRSKLLAAVAMLLVASFMVVSSTYAWFTLSTAPEVTGITTQVGANGNLEIALYGGALPENGMGLTDVLESNRTWGNIVDLSDDGYGLNNIVLKPSVLALGDGATLDQTTPLITPTYGSDGRIQKLSKNGFYGRWNETGFVRAGEGNEGYGVRALGTASSMTAQQLQYANASSAVKTNLDAAYNAASVSLVNNGSGLVTLILKGITDDTANYTVVDDPLTEDKNENELAALGAMINSLKLAPQNLELAIKNYMIAALAKAQETVSDNDFALIVGAFNSNWTDIFTQLKGGASTITVTVAAGESTTGGSYEVPVPPTIASVITAYNDVNSKVTAADTAYQTALAKGAEGVAFAEVKALLMNLMDIEKLAINGELYETIMEWDTDKKANWAIKALTAGIQMEMLEGSGVYASIASVTKNIDASFTAYGVSASYGGLSVNDLDLNIRMFTDLEDITRLNPTAIGEPAAKDTEADAVISDTYGYVLDFAFRTNAAGSSLLLQQDASDRIYGDSTDAESETWGGGSYMEFSTQAGFGDKEVKNLMKHVRIVFVDTLTGDILAVAGLASESATFDGSNVKAAVLLQNYTLGTVEGTEFSKIVANDFRAANDQAIVELGQNEPTYISAYVYLDGETITNADVAAVSELSTSGKLNLQFASSADLVPMDYSDLKPKN